MKIKDKVALVLGASKGIGGATLACSPCRPWWRLLYGSQLGLSCTRGSRTFRRVSAGGVSVNAFKKRTTSTTVELRDGESFVIAGLLQDDFNDTIKQVPWLGDIPILGALFRSTDYQRKQSELVIIVTPHLVTPVRGDALALPTDRVTLPSEKGLFLLGNVAGSKQDSGAAAEVARQSFSGSYGYSMQ